VPNPDRLVRIVAVIVTLMFLMPSPFGLFGPTKVTAGTAVISTFEGGTKTKTLDFTNAKVNDTLGLLVPKASRVISASMDIQSVMVSKPGVVTVDTKNDYLAASPKDLDLNKTWGNAYITEKQNLSDTFNDGSFDAVNWTWMNPPFALNENAGTGMLEVTSNSGTNWTSGLQTGSFMYKNVDGNFMAITKLYATPDANQESCGLMVYQDANNWFQEVYKWRKYGNNGGNYMAFKQRSGGGQSSQDLQGFSASPAWIKFTRYQNSWVVWYSNNGQVYFKWKWFDLAMSSTVRVGLVVYDGLEANNNFRADFDAINITRYMDYGNMSVVPLDTQFPIQRVHLEQDLQQLEVWESFVIQVRANLTGQWQTLVGGTDTRIDTPGTHLEMKISIGGMGWTSPELRSVTLNYYPESWPSNVTLDVGHDGIIEWWFNSTMTIKGNATGARFMKAIEDQKNLLPQDIEGYVHIPCRVVSQSPGKISFQNLAITLFTGHPPRTPVLGFPANNTWLGTRTPTFNFSSVDPDSDTLIYRIQISEDNFNTLSFDFDQRLDKFGWTMGLYDSGKEARFTMDMGSPLDQGKTYQYRVEAYDGGWWSNFSDVRTFKVDVTMPTGYVTDSGPSTPVNKEAFATLKFEDPESGVVAIEAGLGTAKNKTDLVPMTSQDLISGKVHFKNLTLEDKKSYYFTARAKNLAGQWSLNATSKGFRIDLGLDQIPRVNISNPADSSVVDGTVTISGTASDPDIQDTLLVFVGIDDNPWKQALGGKIWSLDWDTKKVPDGTHFIYVKAFDGMRDSVIVDLNVVVGNSRMSFSSSTPPTDTTITETDNVSLSVVLRDPANIFKAYTWSIDGVSVPNVNTASYTFASDYSSSGVRSIEVKAMGVSMSVSHVWNITVLNKNRAPKAIITYPADNMAFEHGKTIMFDGTGSTDADKEVLTYGWEFSDGTTMTGSKVTKAFAKDGKFTAKLTVTDTWNASNDVQISGKMNAKKVDIGQQLVSFPLVLIWLVLVLVIVLVVVMVIVKKIKRQKEFDKKIEQKIEDTTIDDLLYYNPAPQQPGGGPPQGPPAGSGPYQPPQQMPPPGTGQYPPQQMPPQNPPPPSV